jgi:hypothetical protein
VFHGSISPISSFTSHVLHIQRITPVVITGLLM